MGKDGRARCRGNATRKQQRKQQQQREESMDSQSSSDSKHLRSKGGRKHKNKQELLEENCKGGRIRQNKQELLAEIQHSDRRSRHVNNLYNLDSDDEYESSKYEGKLMPQNTERVISPGQRRKLEKLMDALTDKRVTTRCHALESLIKDFESNMPLEVLENRIITLSYQLIDSIKSGSILEVSLASRAQGLLVLTIGSGSETHEILEISIHSLEVVINCETTKIVEHSVIEALSILTFVGGDDINETEKSMKIIWDVVKTKSVAMKKDDTKVMVAAIVSWSFLLTRLNKWRISSKYWKESISAFLQLIDLNNESICVAIWQALALILEMDSIERFSTLGQKSQDYSLQSEHERYQERISFTNSIKKTVENQIGDHLKSTFINQSRRGQFYRILSFLQKGEFEMMEIEILNGYNPVKISSWAQYIQLSFLKKFLGEGYRNLVLHNMYLHDLFNLVPKKTKSSVTEKRLLLLTSTMSTKERTQYLNRCRTWNQDFKQGLFTVEPQSYWI